MQNTTTPAQSARSIRSIQRLASDASDAALRNRVDVASDLIDRAERLAARLPEMFAAAVDTILAPAFDALDAAAARTSAARAEFVAGQI